MAKYYLRPDTDLDAKEQWTATPSTGDSYLLLNEDVIDPQVPDASTGYVRTSAHDQAERHNTTTVTLAVGETVVEARSKAYVIVFSANHRVDVTAFGPSSPVTVTQVGPFEGWITANQGVLTQSQIDLLAPWVSLRELAAEAGFSEVRAYYIELETSATWTYGRTGGTYGDAGATYGDLGGAASSSDTTEPVVTLLSGPTLTRISDESGKDSTDVTFEADEAVQAWKLKIVPSSSSPHTAGTEIESGGALTSGEDKVVNITDDELIAAGGTEGTHTLKLFAQDTAGNWST